DERPSEEIYSELLARTSACDGHILVSFTPVGEGGAAGVTYKFLTEQSVDRAAFRIPGAEVKHISAARREELASSSSDAERETRLEGVPQLGSGPVFPIELLPAITRTFNPNQLPSWARWCVGIDFGFAGGFAAVLIAWAHDTGDIWVIDSFIDAGVIGALSHTADSFDDTWPTGAGELATRWPHPRQGVRPGAGAAVQGVRCEHAAEACHQSWG